MALRMRSVEEGRTGSASSMLVSLVFLSAERALASSVINFPDRSPPESAELRPIELR